MIDSSYIDSILKFRSERDQRVRVNPMNWLSLVGLFPMEEGDNSFGSDDKGSAFLPGLFRGQTGILLLEDGTVTLRSDALSGITVNGKASIPERIRTDMDGTPDLIEIGRYLMKIIRRGPQHYLRVWDRESPTWKTFQGYQYYPIDPKFCINSDFIIYDSPRVIKVQDIIGNISDTHFPGEAHFTINDTEYTLIAEDAEDELLFSFTDKTREDTTYPGGRFFTVPKTENGKVTLDFNLAVNWPCAYTSYATCPLPPFENRLSVRIEAGEKKFHD